MHHARQPRMNPARLARHFALEPRNPSASPAPTAAGLVLWVPTRPRQDASSTGNASPTSARAEVVDRRRRLCRPPLPRFASASGSAGGFGTALASPGRARSRTRVPAPQRRRRRTVRRATNRSGSGLAGKRRRPPSMKLAAPGTMARSGQSNEAGRSPVSGLRSRIRAGVASDTGEAQEPEPADGAEPPRRYAERLLATARQAGDPRQGSDRAHRPGRDRSRTKATPPARSPISKRRWRSRASSATQPGRATSSAIWAWPCSRCASPSALANSFEQELAHARTHGDRVRRESRPRTPGNRLLEPARLQPRPRLLRAGVAADAQARRSPSRGQPCSGTRESSTPSSASATSRSPRRTRPSPCSSCWESPRRAGTAPISRNTAWALTEDRAAARRRAADRSPAAYLGGSIVASVMAGQSTDAVRGRHATTSGPGLLRMAMSATKAMAGFVGSGFKTTSPETQTKTTPDLRRLRAPHRRALQDLRLLHQREEPHAPRRLPDRQMAGMSRDRHDRVQSQVRQTTHRCPGGSHRWSFPTCWAIAPRRSP